jgi:hypothetical protein
MKTGIRFIALGAGLLVAQLAVAQATPPAGSTGICKDGTYSTAASKSGACRGHQGVKEWYASAATAQTPATAPAPVAAPGPVSAPTSASPTVAVPTPGPMAAPSPKASPASKAAGMPQAAGGSPGLVWVNTSSNVYHCYGSDFYGKTKAGAYMTEADAKAKGAHGDHGKACSK